MSELKRTLVEQLEFWRAERPDEWTMDELIRAAKALEAKVTAYQAQMLRMATCAGEFARDASRTQPEATAPAQDLSAAILALSAGNGGYALGKEVAYRDGFKAAREAAAALASSPVDALGAGDRVDAVKFLLKRERRDAQSLASLLAKERARFEFLHSTNCDAEGWEWGVARVRRAADGRIEYLWGLADHSDIDAILQSQGGKNG